MTRRRTNWTEYETARAREYIAARMKPTEFQSRTGRSLATGRAHIKYVDDPVYRQHCIDATVRYRTPRKKGDAPLPTLYGRSEPSVVVPLTVMEEAQKRIAAPKSLTGWICGDPPVGYSQLDLRNASAVIAP